MIPNYNAQVPAIIAKAELSEQQLVERCNSSLSNTAWIVGECASDWTKRYAKGRTDAEFGNLIGLTGDQVYERRRVWETFSDVYNSGTYRKLSWSHFKIAINWDDSAECLQWAEEVEATVAEMKAWRRAQHGEDLTKPAEDEGNCQGFLNSSAEPIESHPRNTNPVVDHKQDYATDNGEMVDVTSLVPGKVEFEKPDRIERETPVVREPEVSRLADFLESIRAMQKLSEQHEQHGARDQLESLAKFHEVRAFKIRKRLEGHS